MPEFIDLLINLAAALIGFLIARAWAWRRRRRRTAAGRRFWAPFAESVVVVLPVWERTVEGWTSSEILGPGDVRALLRLQAALIDVDRRCEVLEASRVDEATGNLVLLGGADANSVTARFLARYPASASASHRHFEFDEHQTLKDVSTGATYGSTPTGGHDRDAGLLFRAPNPFGPGTVLLLAGVTGVGTDAAARLVSEQLAELSALVPADPERAVEIVFTVEVLHGVPQGPSIEASRELTVAPRTSTTSSS